MLTFIEGCITLFFGFAICFNLISRRKTDHFVDVLLFIAGIGVMILPFLRMDETYFDFDLIWWHFYIVSHFELLILGGVLSVAYYYKFHVLKRAI